jgi:hypothetical protein
MDVEREEPESTEHSGDSAWEHACPLLSEAALGDWSSEEEDAAWNHLQGRPGKDLLRFAGAIPAEELDAIEQIIAEECERIDHDDW